MKKDAIQSAKGKIRAAKAQRDAKGRFVKAGRPEGLFAIQPEVQPNIQPGTQPEGAKNIRSGQNPAEIQPNVQPESSPASSRKSSLYVTAAITQENDAEKKESYSGETGIHQNISPMPCPDSLVVKNGTKTKRRMTGVLVNSQPSTLNSQLKYSFMPQGFTTDPLSRQKHAKNRERKNANGLKMRRLAFLSVHPKRIELLSEVPETSILSIELQVRCSFPPVILWEKLCEIKKKPCTLLMIRPFFRTNAQNATADAHAFKRQFRRLKSFCQESGRAGDNLRILFLSLPANL